MPLVSMVEELQRAREGGYAIPLFDTFDMFSTDGMFNAAEEQRAPFMIISYYYQLVLIDHRPATYHSVMQKENKESGSK